jgi:amino acid transporter
METPLENRKIEIDQETLRHLNTARKWAMFLAITGFIFLCLVIIIGIIAGTFLTAFSSGEKNLGIPEFLVIIPLIVLVAVYFFPVLFLFRFSKHTSHAIQNLDKLEFHKAIRNLKSYFAYIGIITIIVLSFYIVIIIITGSTMDFLKGL